MNLHLLAYQEDYNFQALMKPTSAKLRKPQKRTTTPQRPKINLAPLQPVPQNF